MRPHALILYVNMLAKLHMRAGRKLVAVRPFSCMSLNGRRWAPLYGPPSVDLLDVVGKYELIPPLHSAAVGKWLTQLPPPSRSDMAIDPGTCVPTRGGFREAFAGYYGQEAAAEIARANVDELRTQAGFDHLRGTRGRGGCVDFHLF